MLWPVETNDHTKLCPNKDGISLPSNNSHLNQMPNPYVTKNKKIKKIMSHK